MQLPARQQSQLVKQAELCNTNVAMTSGHVEINCCTARYDARNCCLIRVLPPPRYQPVVPSSTNSVSHGCLGSTLPMLLHTPLPPLLPESFYCSNPTSEVCFMPLHHKHKSAWP